MEIKGIIVAMVSPFDERGELRSKAYRRLLDRVIDAGVDGVFVNGSQGEFFSLTAAERNRALELSVEHVAGRVAVYAGVGAVTTREAVELTRAAESIGCDAVSALTPYFINLTETELGEHYRAIAAATRLPVLLYGSPARTGQRISVELVRELATVENIAGIKDSSGELSLTDAYIRATEDAGFSVIAGRDTLIYATLAYGGAGSIAATANVAAHLAVRIYRAVRDGDHEQARAAQRELAPLREAFGLGSFPVVMKEAVRMMGYDLGLSLPPIGPMSEAAREELRGLLERMGLLGEV